jgi:hypothetical protein
VERVDCSYNARFMKTTERKEYKQFDRETGYSFSQRRLFE